MRQVIVVLLCFLISNFISGQATYQEEDPIPEAKLLKDLEILKDNLEKVHTGLYTYTSKKEFDDFFKKTKAAISSPMNDIDFYRLLAPLQQKIKNGHSMIIPSEAWDEKKTEIPIFPFDVYQYGDTLFLLRNLSRDASLKPGSSIKSINGENTSEIFNRLLENTTSDGHNRTFPAKLIGLDFSEFYANIIGTPSHFEVELVEPDGTERKVKVHALLNDELKKTSLSRYSLKRLPWYIQEDENLSSLKIDGETALLHVPTFDSSSKGDNGLRYSKYYKDAFQRIRDTGVKNLILDLRDNGGGDPKPQLALLSHLCNQPIILYKKVYTITKKFPNPKLYQGNTSWLNFKLAVALKKKGEEYVLRNWVAKKFGITNKPTNPSPNVFTGKLYVLVDGGSFSATGEVVGMLKTYRKDAIFVGEETGGNPFANTSGIMEFLTLPNSKVRVRMSLVRFDANVDFVNDGHGARPDYEMRNSIEDELKQRDAVMEFTKNLIKKGA